MAPSRSEGGEEERLESGGFGMCIGGGTEEVSMRCTSSHGINQPSICTRARRWRRKRSAAPSRMARMASGKRRATSDEVDMSKTR